MTLLSAHFGKGGAVMTLPGSAYFNQWKGAFHNEIKIFVFYMKFQSCDINLGDFQGHN